MKIIFAGTPEFAIPALEALLNSTHKIVAVYTRPDRPAGRGRKLTASPVKEFALAHHIAPVYQPESLKNETAQEEMRTLQADILVNVAYGMLLPKTILEIPKYGCINIHPSLLPRWRGAAPIQRAILAGDKITGVSIMQMDEGLDTGDIYKQKELPIEDNDTSETLMNKASIVGAKLLLDVIEKIASGSINHTPQTEAETTYAQKLEKEEGKIDWQKSAIEIERAIRAFQPWPIAYTEINNETIRVWQAAIVNNTNESKTPGTIINANKNGIDIATGNGTLRLLKIQLPGGKILTPQEFLNSHKNLKIKPKS